MSYFTLRVEITRDEWQADAPVGIEITAYIDRVPETQDYSRGMLTRAPKGVWNSRLQFAGDFDELPGALVAVDERYPAISIDLPPNMTSRLRIRQTAQSDRWCSVHDVTLFRRP